jgi:hypothetical protein
VRRIKGPRVHMYRFPAYNNNHKPIKLYELIYRTALFDVFNA